MNIKINNLLLNVFKSSKDGLRFIDYLPKNSGAFFIYDKVQPEINFHMRNVKFPLDIIGIDSNKKINQIYQAYPEQENIILKDILYVLETRKNLMKENKIKIGDKVNLNFKLDTESIISSIINPLRERRDYGEKGRDFLEQQIFDLDQQEKLPIELKWELKKKKRASIIDYPQKSLSPYLWENSQELNSEVRKKIITNLINVLGILKDAKKWISAITITGSITTNQYQEKTDVDINVEIDYKLCRKLNPKLKLKLKSDLELRTYLRDIIYQLNDICLAGKHPTKYFVIGKGHRLESDFIYDVLKNKWIKSPKLVPIDFNPDKEFREQKNKAKEIIIKIIKIFLTIKMFFDDLERIREAGLRNLKKEKTLKEGIKTLVLELKIYYESIKNLRKIRFEKKDIKLLGMKFSKNWEENNIIFKYIEKYGFKNPYKTLRLILTNKQMEILDNILE